MAISGYMHVILLIIIWLCEKITVLIVEILFNLCGPVAGRYIDLIYGPTAGTHQIKKK